MNLDSYDWRPITFQGETFPPSFMGVSILVEILPVSDEVVDWLWSLRICCGREQNASAATCARFSGIVGEQLLTHREQVIEGIQDRLGSHGFEAGSAYDDWVTCFGRIADLSAKSKGECVWSAPTHPNDPFASEAGKKKQLDLMDRARERYLAENPLATRRPWWQFWKRF